MLRAIAAKTALLVVVSLALSACPGIDEAARPPREHGVAQDWAEIRETFAAYKEAVIERDGETAGSLVSTDTLNHYEDMRRLAATAGPAQIQSQSFINRLLITRMRLEIPQARLRSMDGRETFAFGITQGWTSDASLSRQELGRISVEGDVANAAQTGGTPSSYDFHREDGSWRLDLMAIIASSNMVFQEVVEQSGQSENEYLFTLLESVTGRRVSKSIWERPNRK